MEYIINRTNFQYKNTAVALGKFEGLHLGHQLLFRELKKCEKQGMKSVVFTFDMPPKRFINGMEENVIYTEEERICLLERMGMDVMIAYPFKAIRNLPPELFVKEILVNQLDVKVIVVGDDFHFGYERAGNIELLRQLSSIYGYELRVINKLQYEGDAISSSRIRQAMIDGNLLLANELLGYPYTIVGTVVHGKQLGRTIGMPTANIVPNFRKYLPPNGVYVARIYFEQEKQAYYGICNLGVKPTVDSQVEMGLETYIFDFEQDIYGRIVTVQLLQFVRPEMKFTSINQLSLQMHKDANVGREYVKKIKSQNEKEDFFTFPFTI